MSWFYIALLVPFLYALTNLFDDNKLQFVFEGPFMSTALAGIFGLLPILSLLFLRTHNIPLAYSSLAVLAGILTTTYFFFYFRALQLEQPSVVIAMFSLVPATIPFLAHFFLHENLSAWEIVGFIIVLIASLALTATDIKKFQFSKALLPALIVVVLLDIISLLTKHVYQHVQFYPAYMYFSVGVGIGGIVFLVLMYTHKRSKDLRKLKISIKKVIPILIVSEALAVGADFSLNLAISRGPVSLVRVIEGTQPMYVLIIALLLYPLAPKFFREAAAGGSKLIKLSLMGVIIVGLVLINFAAHV